MLRAVSLLLTALLLISGCGVFPAAAFTAPLADCEGDFAGSFSGTDQGIVAVAMSSNGAVAGTVISALAGTVGLQGVVQANGSFLGTASTGAIFEGQLNNNCTVSGTWFNGFFSGRWSASLIK